MPLDSTVDGRAGIDAALVRRLIAEQFPLWAGLPVRPVAIEGWDNRTYHLGDEMTVRLPTAGEYVAAIEMARARAAIASTAAGRRSITTTRPASH